MIEVLQRNAGNAVMTRGIAEKMYWDPIFSMGVAEAFGRFLDGDWGITCDEDKAVNDEDPQYALAAYMVEDEKIWIKADDYGDRVVITVLFPDEY